MNPNSNAVILRAVTFAEYKLRKNLPLLLERVGVRRINTGKILNLIPPS
jgi:hypothetical protein